jgi:hypothetical protein
MDLIIAPYIQNEASLTPGCPRVRGLLFLLGYGAAITGAAMHVCVSKHIEVLITSPRYGIMAMFVPSPIINAKVKIGGNGAGRPDTGGKDNHQC